MAELQPQQRKRKFPANTNWQRCLCHQDNVSGPLVSFSTKSWSTFETCAKRRKDSISKQIEGHWEDGPKGFYHRRCYQVYTDKYKVARAEKQNDEQDSLSSSVDEIVVCGTGKRQSRSQFDHFDIEKCAICQKDKIKKGTKSREPLTLNMTDTASSTLTNAALIRNDERLCKEIQHQDTIALEIKYHGSCYRDYVHPKILEKIENGNCDKEDTFSGSYSRAFNKIKDTVLTKVLKQAQAMNMCELLKMYIKFLKEEGIDAPNYRSSKLKSRLTKTFGVKLSYQKPKSKNQPEIVFSGNLSTGEVVEKVVDSFAQDRCYNQVEITDDETESVEHRSREIFHAAKMIRTLVGEIKAKMPWPPAENDLDCESAIVPDELYNMLAWICSSSQYSETRVADVGPDTHRVVLSLAQDLIYAVSRGRIKTPKHVTLPLTVKSLTGNAELITILNRLGHGIAYSQVEELETALAEKEVDKQQQGIIIPSNCTIGVPAVFCWDNNDLLEETLSGTIIKRGMICELNFIKH